MEDKTKRKEKKRKGRHKQGQIGQVLIDHRAVGHLLLK